MTPDERYMQRCLELAAKGLGMVSPNPLVGCVIVHKGRVIGEGYHHKYGGAHAEVNAIASVEDKELLAESTLYVNLEPCAHFGKTPPCADLIVSFSIPRVVVGSEDPFPSVAGKGIKRLRDAGVEVESGILEKHCHWMNRRFFTYHTKGRPYIILKWASSSDGFLAPGEHGPEQRERWWITGNVAKVLVHKWRSEEDSILTGMGTILADNPELNVRNWEGAHPLRVIIDRQLSLNGSERVFNPEGKVLVLNEIREETEGHIEYVRIESGVDLITQMLAELHERKVHSLLVEGGLQVLNSFIRSENWDEARILKGSKRFTKGIPAPAIPNPPAYEGYAGEDQLFIHYK